MSSMEGGGAARALFATRSVKCMWALPSFDWLSSSSGIGRLDTACSMESRVRLNLDVARRRHRKTDQSHQHALPAWPSHGGRQQQETVEMPLIALLALAIVSPQPALLPRAVATGSCRRALAIASSSEQIRSKAAKRTGSPSSASLLHQDADNDEQCGLPVYRTPKFTAVLLMLVFWSWPWALSFLLAQAMPAAAVAGAAGPSAGLVSALSCMTQQLDMLEVVASRLLVAAACGAIIGLERKDADRPAGLRSMTLVSSGSALYTLACVFGIEGGDPVRAAAQVCTGVGFIGAGVIAKGSVRDPVRGVTTACAVWVSAALGVVAAAGMWLFAFYSTGISISILRISRWCAYSWPRVPCAVRPVLSSFISRHGGASPGVGSPGAGGDGMRGWGASQASSWGRPPSASGGDISLPPLGYRRVGGITGAGIRSLPPKRKTAPRSRPACLPASTCLSASLFSRPHVIPPPPHPLSPPPPGTTASSYTATGRRAPVRPVPPAVTP